MHRIPDFFDMPPWPPRKRLTLNRRTGQVTKHERHRNKGFGNAVASRHGVRHERHSAADPSYGQVASNSKGTVEPGLDCSTAVPVIV